MLSRAVTVCVCVFVPGAVFVCMSLFCKIRCMGVLFPYLWE